MGETTAAISAGYQVNFGAKLDGRCRMARRMKVMRLDLLSNIAHPSPAQVAVIDRVVACHVQLLALDGRAAAGEPLGPRELELYTSLNSSVVRSLRALGLKAAPTANDSLEAYNIGRLAARRGAAA